MYIDSFFNIIYAFYTTRHLCLFLPYSIDEWEKPILIGSFPIHYCSTVNLVHSEIRIGFFVTVTICLYIREIFKLYDEEKCNFCFLSILNSTKTEQNMLINLPNTKLWFRCSIYVLHALSSTANLLLP